MISPWWSTDGASLFLGDCLEIMPQLPRRSADLIFADPPYFLSNGGTTCANGQRVSVDKGEWDAAPLSPRGMHSFNRAWLEAAQRLLTDDGTIWVSGTSHVIYSVGFAMQQLGFKILNDVAWEKPNPPPNLCCRYFTHSTETLIWAAKDSTSRHHFNYQEMKGRNGDKQMKNVWRMPAPRKTEKRSGKHPTQKPLALLERIIAASCPPRGRVLDPFNGSGTTGVAARERYHDYTGIDALEHYLSITRARLT